MIKPHEIDFKKFIEKWTIEGARKYFEQFIFEFLRIKYDYHKGIKTFRRNPGDWGIDVICGKLEDNNIIWQCKFFLDGIGESQKNQIRKSYNDVLRKSREKHFKILRWILCLPIDFSTDEFQWWNKWKQRMEDRDNLQFY
jgi:predicted helicase